MPHHAVYRESTNSTTKTRIVFNASSSTRQSKSLNQNVETGPNLYPNITSVLLNLRNYKIVFISDITKAFLQIHVKQEDRNALCFLWYSTCPKPNEPLPPIEIWRKIGVPFGLKCSPFLLGACIRKLLELHKEEFPETVKKLEKMIYVDDIFIGAQDPSEAYKLYTEIKELFSRASFSLHKFSSNSAQLVTMLNQESMKKEESWDMSPTLDIVKILGLAWSPISDTFFFRMDYVLDQLKKGRKTKRFILETFARIYDPLGFIAPTLITGKINMQDLWRKQFNWDEALPKEVLENWYTWFNNLTILEKIQIPRFYTPTLDHPTIHSLHIFCDASKLAYGAVCFLVSHDALNRVTSSLFLARTRVAPIKEQTVPRLELLAAVMGAKLASFVKDTTSIQIDNCYFWSDSSIVLFWLTGEPSKWSTYVRNRVNNVRQLTDVSKWKHCPGEQNPADLLTRGISAEKLVVSSLWWGGPVWLTRPEIEWPATPETKCKIDMKEVNKEEVHNMVTLSAATEARREERLIDCERFSSLIKLLRTTVYVSLAVQLLCKRQTSTSIDSENLSKAQRLWIRWIQKETFSTEIEATKGGIPVNKKSVLKDHVLMLDEEGMLRVQTRLGHHLEGMIESSPIVLPGRHQFVNLLIQDRHERLMHAGVRDTLADLRRSYYILKGRQVVKWVLDRCCGCRLFKARAYTQPVAPLPADRVSRQQPFETSGVDFCGPFYVKRRKDEVPVKGYVLIFTCAAVRAVHFEYTQDMSTKEFLLAFRRFVARRGNCRKLYSDNAKTFLKAASDLKELERAIWNPEVKEAFANYGISWSFIAERAPWWGGFWERMVRSLKESLRRTLHRATLTMSEFTTVLAEAEAVINSRPLTYLYSGPLEVMPLTPAHFLIGTKRSDIPPTSSRDPPQASAKEIERLWRTRQSIMNNFWKVWYKEYLQELRSFHRAKYVLPTDPKRGDLVLIEEHSPRLLWKSAVIVEVQPGRDGRVRSCLLRVASGKQIRRAVQHLYLLEASEEGGEGGPSMGCVTNVETRTLASSNF